jgi:hypothetical protein
MDLVLRPSFAALVAAEGELGPLFALVERVGAGGLRLEEIVGLFWHLARERPEGLTRETMGEAIAALGLGGTAALLRVMLQQIVMGR